ncbi:MAG TPA: radical SAM family heme chaperone HemW [Terrimicrobium sp.]
MISHLYVHIPFCPKVCPYCSFYKEASDRSKTRGFLDAVLAEAEHHAWQLAPQTIFFGGGTPTALSTSQLEFLIGGLRARINFANLQEFTVEMNPATVSLEKAAALRGLGVNRVSMGVQSWDAGLLATLGRIHSASQAQRSYEILREAGFKNINLDLIFGVPGQTRDHWRASLEKTIALNPSHISAYCLTYEEDTEYFLRMSRGEYRPDETLDADLFEMTIDTLEDAGFCQYEISNYSRPGRECRHNLAYWLGADFLGLGPSAFSTVGVDRWKNVSNTSAYAYAIEGGGDVADFRETLTTHTRQLERIAFSLRTDRGVPSDFLPSPEAEALANLGLLASNGGRWRLTRKGKLLADSVAEMLI